MSVVMVEVPKSRKPMPILAYLAAFIMGLLYLFDVATAASLAGTTDQFSATLWQVVLTAAGATALVAVALPRRWVTRALVLESAAAGVIAFELSIYVAVLMFGVDPGRVPWATVVWLGLPVCGGLAARSIGAMRDRKRRLLLSRAGVPEEG